MLKNEQDDLKKKRMDNLNELLQYNKQNCFQKNGTKPHFGTYKKKINSAANDFAVYKKK